MQQQLKREPLKASEVFSESGSEDESDSAESSVGSESDDDVGAKYVHSIVKILLLLFSMHKRDWYCGISA